MDSDTETYITFADITETDLNISEDEELENPLDEISFQNFEDKFEEIIPYYDPPKKDISILYLVETIL